MSGVVVHRTLKGKTLVSTDQVGPLPAGLTVYCFEDEGSWFRIITPQPILGSYQFKLAATHKGAFTEV